jgi:hypothetical protein
MPSTGYRVNSWTDWPKLLGLSGRRSGHIQLDPAQVDPAQTEPDQTEPVQRLVVQRLVVQRLADRVPPWPPVVVE